MSVLRYIANITIENLSHLIDSCVFSILFPEVFLNMRHGVNSDSIKVELLNCIFNPVKESLSHELVVLIEVWKVSQPAILNLILVIPVFNLALNMIVLALIERCHLIVIGINVSNMVGNYV